MISYDFKGSVAIAVCGLVLFEELRQCVYVCAVELVDLLLSGVGCLGHDHGRPNDSSQRHSIGRSQEPLTMVV